MNKLLTGVSLVTLLAIGPAIAQTKSPDPSVNNAPTITAPAPGAGSGSAAMPSATQTATGQWRASNLLNSSIRNAANETVGDINDLLVDNSGKVTSVIVGVGGFLGIGERNVAVTFDQLQFSRDANNKVVITGNMLPMSSGTGVS